MNGRIVSINISTDKGKKKVPHNEAFLLEGLGIKGDAHAGSKRQISLLALESISKMGVSFKPGDFAENITTEGIDLLSVPVGTKLQLGAALIEITEHGKVCHDRCEIFRIHGRCVMPEEGVFAKVIKNGSINAGDFISLAKN